MSTQSCPAEGCKATYAAAILEVTDRCCPECGESVIECPVCQTIVRIGDIWDRNACPACYTHRLDLGDTVREAAHETGVIRS